MNPTRDHLECPFCLGLGQEALDAEKLFGYVSVILDDKALLDRHFKGDLPKKLECRTCGAVAEYVVGCCKVRYEWIRKRSPEDYRDVARFECSDCGASYYARIVERGGHHMIGEKVPAPPATVQVRCQRMLCGDCRGMGGPGDRLQDLLERQRGGDPFGLL